MLLTREEVEKRAAVVAPKRAAPKQKPVLNGGDMARNSQKRQLRLLKKVLAAQIQILLQLIVAKIWKAQMVTSVNNALGENA